MRTTIDEAGRVVVPKLLRDAIGLHGRGEVELTAADGTLEMVVAPTEVELVERDGLVVAEPLEALPPLTADQVRETLEQTRR